jgi:hypothetical protein
MLILLLVAGALPARADETSYPHQHTTAPPGARFEIVQSQRAARWTFRLDRFTGRVSQLVNDAAGDAAWRAMDVSGLPALPSASRPRFQIFTSGLAARDTYLLDTRTGWTWVLSAATTTGADGVERDVVRWDRVRE